MIVEHQPKFPKAAHLRWWDKLTQLQRLQEYEFQKQHYFCNAEHISQLSGADKKQMFLRHIKKIENA
jgi:hypothetical protein